MSTPVFRANFLKYGQALEEVTYKDTVVQLLASGDGTEIIRYRIKSGGRWGMLPEEEWNALETVLVMSGILIWKSSKGDIKMEEGDLSSFHPVSEHIVFDAVTDVELIYISSRPVFHHYSKIAKDLMEMAVEIEMKDGYTAGHCERIRTYSVQLGEKLPISVNDLYILSHAAYFHDIGKVRVPENILFKPGRLTDEEFNIMKLHTTYGYEILKAAGIPFLTEAGKIVEQHHERFDGKGYPHGLKGDEIDIKAAIISVVDSYDAMTTDRVYQKGRTKQEAMDEIKRCSGTMYHPLVVDEFLKLLSS